MVMKMEKHNIKPIYDYNSKILILGSFPSVKSREAAFYYQHPQNRFWKIISKLYNAELNSIEDKKNILLNNNIALWDVIKSCDIKGSSDNSINNIEVNNISEIIKNSQIKEVYTNGKKAYELYNKYCLSETHINAILLPSTSPANAVYTLEKLIDKWKIIKD
jgi:hypoxanthine-DNA glycosylase